MLVRWLHPRPSPYEPVWRNMQAFTESRQLGTPDEIWLTEHYPVYTLGQAGRPEHLLHTTDIPLIHTDRGGQITYHGPGQVVAYVLFDLKRAGYFIKEYVHRVESAVIHTLAQLGLNDATRKAGAPGVYVPWPRSPNVALTHPSHAPTLAKIAALGIKVRNGCTYHGVALNVAMDLTPYEHINPCGYVGLRTVDLAACKIQCSLTDCGELLAMHVANQLTPPANNDHS